MAYSTILLPQIMKSDGNISSVTESNLTNSTYHKHLIVGKDQASWIGNDPRYRNETVVSLRI